MTANLRSEGPLGGELASKVPQVTILFWVIKILATTVGETGGDAVSMTFNLGYAVASVIFLSFFAVTLATQVAAKRYPPFPYWALVVPTPTPRPPISAHPLPPPPPPYFQTPT